MFQLTTSYLTLTHVVSSFLFFKRLRHKTHPVVTLFLKGLECAADDFMQKSNFPIINKRSEQKKWMSDSGWK